MNWRKLSHASHSRRGDEFRARAMSVVMTGRNIGMPVYEYLRRICAEANTKAGGDDATAAGRAATSELIAPSGYAPLTTP